MIDILIFGILAAIMISNVISPFAFAMGYVWVDIFYPQFISYNVFHNTPLAGIIGGLMGLSYVLADRGPIPKIKGMLALYVLFGLDITFTTYIAVEPEAAWVIYNPAVKVLIAAAFIPLVFRTRVRIEAFIQVILFAACAHILPWGIKVLISGGGYGKSLGLISSNGSALSESSTMADFAFASVPLFIYLVQHNTILNWPLRQRKILFGGLMLLFSVGALGSYARTGLVTLGMVFGGYWLRSKRKMLLLSLAAVLGIGLLISSASSWTNRMQTIVDYQQDNSAETRLVVWKWAWDFTKDHPFGGGFGDYLQQNVETDQIGPDGQHVYVTRRAFHSIYFAVLAEHGYPGVLLFISILAGSFRCLYKVRQATRGLPEEQWCYDLAGHLQIGLFAFLCGAAFIDASFYAVLWYQLALCMCLREYTLQNIRQPNGAAALPAVEPANA